MRYKQRDEAHIGRNMGEEWCEVGRQKGPGHICGIGRNPGLKEKLIALAMGDDCKLRRLWPAPLGEVLDT